MKAEIEIECKNPEMIINSIKPDMDERKFVVKLKAKENELKLEISANDVSSLLAGINSYMRLIKSSMGVLND